MGLVLVSQVNLWSVLQFFENLFQPVGTSGPGQWANSKHKAGKMKSSSLKLQNTVQQQEEGIIVIKGMGNYLVMIMK